MQVEIASYFFNLIFHVRYRRQVALPGQRGLARRSHSASRAGGNITSLRTPHFGQLYVTWSVPPSHRSEISNGAMHRPHFAAVK
jgi:hypothetical protein